MNAAAMLMMPWRTTLPGTRRLILGTMALALMGALAFEVFWRGSSPSIVAAVITGYAEFFVGMLLLAPFLLLAIDAKQLRLPRVQPSIIGGLVLYGVLLVMVPSAILGVVGGDITILVAIHTLGLMLGLSIGLLPRYFAMAFGLTPILFNLLKPHFTVAHPDGSTFLEIWATTALLCAICAWCWWRQMRIADPYQQGFGKPMVLQTRNNHQIRWNGWDGWGAYDSTRQICSQPQWLQPIADLRDIGPQHPRRSLRIALGGWLLPKTWQSVLRQWSVILAPLVVFAVLLELMRGFRIAEIVLDILRALSLGAWVWMGGFASAGLSLVVVLVLQQRWRKTNAELPLLALLPQLGRGALLIKHLLGASLLRLLSIQSAVLLLLLFAAVAKHTDGLSLCILLLSQVAAGGFALAFALANFGGCSLPTWSVGVIAGICFTLVGLDNVCMPFFSDAPVVSNPLRALLAAAWVILLIGLVWLGWRGWHGLQKRPHPFLAH